MDTTNVGWTNYYFKKNLEFSCVTYQNEEISNGDKLNLQTLFQKKRIHSRFWIG